YGLQMQTRGWFNLYQFKVNLTGNIVSIIDDNSVKLNKSNDGFFGNADDASVSNLQCDNTQVHGYGFSTFFYSTGNADGSLATAAYYFVTANVKTSPNAAATFAFSAAPLLKSSDTEANYPDVPGTVSNGATGNSN